MPVHVNESKSAGHDDAVILDAIGRSIGIVRVTHRCVLWIPAKAAKFSKVTLSSFVDWLTRPPAKAVRKNCDVVPGARA